METRLQEGEVFLVNKPYKWTSFDVVNNLRAFLKNNCNIPKIKMGHAGTLDPLATGLLIICTGKFTKKIDDFQGLEKEYTGTFRLGATTPCFDLEKEIDQLYPWEHITNEMIQAAVQELSGTYDQMPPVFSAKKVNGRRAYKYARKNKEVELQPRTITISAFETTRIEMPDIDFRVICSKGTYIRALARDLGTKLDSGAHLTALCRTRIGPYHLRDAFDVESLKKSWLPG
jgi:tRNA pseudouridine55 synthase